jgi:hypothetical protein
MYIQDKCISVVPYPFNIVLILLSDHIILYSITTKHSQDTLNKANKQQRRCKGIIMGYLTIIRINKPFTRYKKTSKIFRMKEVKWREKDKNVPSLFHQYMFMIHANIVIRVTIRVHSKDT